MVEQRQFLEVIDRDEAQQRFHNALQLLPLGIELVPLDTKPPKRVWDNCDVLLIDSDSSRGILKHFAKFKVPVIGLDAEYSDRYHLNIVTDHHMGGRMVAERLLEKGSKKACMVYFQNAPARITARY